jgi:two-component sensor histidine kinase
MITIGWSVSAENGGGSLRFRWQERGGPLVSHLARTGFGTSLLKATLCDGRIEYAADGLTYEVAVPLSKIALAKGDADMSHLTTD